VFDRVGVGFNLRVKSQCKRLQWQVSWHLDDE